MKIDKNDYFIIELFLVSLMLTTPFLIDLSVRNDNENRQENHKSSVQKTADNNSKDKSPIARTIIPNHEPRP
jgi:hypothetical protein